MAGSGNSELSENLSIRITRRDKELLERICKARGEDPSDFVRRAVRKELQSYATCRKRRRKHWGSSDKDLPNYKKASARGIIDRSLVVCFKRIL